MTNDEIISILPNMIEEVMTRVLDTKLDAKLDVMLDAKLDVFLDAKLDVLLDAKLTPRFDALYIEMDRRFEAMDRKFSEKFDAYDIRFQSIEDRLKRIEVDLLENNIIPRLNTIENCYTSAFKRYKNDADRMEQAFTDIDVLKTVVAGHSQQLEQLTSAN